MTGTKYVRNESDSVFLDAIDEAIAATEHAVFMGVPLRNDCAVASDRAASLTEALENLDSAMGQIRLARKHGMDVQA